MYIFHKLFYNFYKIFAHFVFLSIDLVAFMHYVCMVEVLISEILLIQYHYRRNFTIFRSKCQKATTPFVLYVVFYTFVVCFMLYVHVRFLYVYVPNILCINLYFISFLL